MRETCESGSVGGLGGQPPRPTRLASGKLGKGGRASNSETFYWNPAGVNPAWQSRASSQKRVLRGAG
jgi:hypothetical protein